MPVWHLWVPSAIVGCHIALRGTQGCHHAMQGYVAPVGAKWHQKGAN